MQITTRLSREVGTGALRELCRQQERPMARKRVCQKLMIAICGAIKSASVEYGRMPMLTAEGYGFSDTRMGNVIVWFDGSCPLCTREIALMRWLDWRGAITFHDVSPPDAICPLDRHTLLARFHASEKGVLLSGAAAFAAMWRAIPLLKPLGWAARHPTVLALLERAYVRFLNIRPRIQRAVAKR